MDNFKTMYDLEFQRSNKWFQAIARVRELHKPEVCGDKDCHHSHCGYCTDLVDWAFVDYPCPTIQALDGDK